MVLNCVDSKIVFTLLLLLIVNFFAFYFHGFSAELLLAAILPRIFADIAVFMVSIGLEFVNHGFSF